MSSSQSNLQLDWSFLSSLFSHFIISGVCKLLRSHLSFLLFTYPMSRYFRNTPALLSFITAITNLQFTAWPRFQWFSSAVKTNRPFLELSGIGIILFNTALSVVLWDDLGCDLHLEKAELTKIWLFFRLNFSLRHMDVCCEAYTHFLCCLQRLQQMEDHRCCFTFQQLTSNFAQVLLYERVEQLVCKSHQTFSSVNILKL